MGKYICSGVNECENYTNCMHSESHIRSIFCREEWCDRIKRQVRCVRVYDELDELFDDLCEEL